MAYCLLKPSAAHYFEMFAELLYHFVKWVDQACNSFLQYNQIIRYSKSLHAVDIYGKLYDIRYAVSSTKKWCLHTKSFSQNEHRVLKESKVKWRHQLNQRLNQHTLIDDSFEGLGCSRFEAWHSRQLLFITLNCVSGHERFDSPFFPASRG